jgi:NAD+ kinase
MRFGIIGNTSKQPLDAVLSALLSFLQRNAMPYVLHRELWNWYVAQPGHTPVPPDRAIDEAALAQNVDMVIALGGDGTMLSTARILDGATTPILGVNLGKLGFLAEVSVGEIEQFLQGILKGDYFIEERMLIECTCRVDDSTMYAMNEIVIDKGASARVIELETKVNDDLLVTYSADGIIINTPTGSTAYSLATGGPIVTPQSNVMTIIPVAPHTLTARPVIVPDTSNISITVTAGSKQIHVTADGQVERLYATPVEFSIRKANRSVRLVKRRGRSYFDLLRTKLLWGRDVRRENSL